MDKVKQFFGSVFSRLNLTERGNAKLSLTNLAVAVCIVKVAVATQISIPEIGALLLSLLNYAHKRTESSKFAIKEQSSQSQSVDIEAEMKDLRAILEDQQAKIASQEKVVEEAKSMLTATKLAGSQKRQQL